MTGADYFGVIPQLNPYELEGITIDRERVNADFARIEDAVRQTGIEVIRKPSPEGCQDGVFTANWGICRGDTVVLGSLPPYRTQEHPFAESYLKELGKRVVQAPYRFSGQGDSLPCGNILFAGSGFRSDPRMHGFLAQELGYEVISLETLPRRDADGKVIMNPITDWPDSYFYDIDLALSILRTDLIAWCPEAFSEESQAIIRNLTQFEKIEVSRDEAVKGYACNLVSSGSTVVMSAHAPQLQAAIEQHGLETIAVDIPELAKGGGSIRCCTLTLDNE